MEQFNDISKITQVVSGGSKIQTLVFGSDITLFPLLPLYENVLIGLKFCCKSIVKTTHIYYFLNIWHCAKHFQASKISLQSNYARYYYFVGRETKA